MNKRNTVSYSCVDEIKKPQNFLWTLMLQLMHYIKLMAVFLLMQRSPFQAVTGNI